MKRIFLTGLFASLIAVACFAQKPYKVVFYNFENLFDTIHDPGVLDEEFTPEGPKKWNSAKYTRKIGNLERVLFDIAAEDKDYPVVIGVSEIENRSVMEDVIAQPKLAPGNYRIVHYDSPEARGVDVAFMYRPDVFKLEGSFPVKTVVPQLPNFKTRDILTMWGTIENEPFFFMVAHWPSRLGGKDWDKQKSKVRESLKELAFDLVKLYAERQKNRGYAFGPDTPWQQEFEENFPYDETPDQLQATEEIKRDMERDLPMDRLLCGDVGYGKTEVALRAAFKAVMDGKQVAILAPTTILAQQHYNTLMRRMEGFPVHADVLSRFRSAKEQKESLRRLKDGEIDIIVGTHRLLAKDVQFKNLGLLIVDEEQRFGVGHKESIKNMKKTVDVLTMSATPIPRTLHMSMVGIRDMSLLETPPQARYPVQTYVMEYQDSVIRDAILREIGRGGQVFFLYNRVGSIDQCYKQLSKLVPEARIAIAHGQMREHALEDVMLDFSQQKFDVLLCTTIIESGLDIPMANTLIIYDADHFGLGQLYQMRGRVGRSNRLAYAYFTVRPGKVLSETAQKRLDAIREFTEFGSGFRIAMRDLELRGAGNLLGPQQSGYLANIGYDLYCKLLEEAVLEAQGEAPKPNRDVETRMDVHVNAYLPAEYVTGDRQRLEVYKRIASITTAAQRDDVEEELVDRFGDEPLCVANLVAVAYLKAMCEKLGIDRVNQADGRIDMRFALNAQVDGQKLFTALNGFDKRLTLNAAPPVTLTLRDQTLNREDLLMLCVKVMERLLARMELSAA